MPNWCQNVVTFAHPDPAQVQRLTAAFNGEGMMQEFVPCPNELLDERTSTYGGPDAAKYDAVRADLKARFGFTGWYDWRMANWGTKWDISSREGGEADPQEGDTGVRITFDSAWNPPIEFYQQMEKLGWEVDAFYYEPGNAFCGRYRNSSNSCHDITGNSDWVDTNIPEDINNMFAIAENMAEWEQEEEELVQDED